MDINLLFCILLVLSMFGLLMMGFPVAFTLGGVSIFWGLLGVLTGNFDLGFFGVISSRIYGNAINNYVLLAVPLFIFMGIMLEKSNVAEELLTTMAELFGPLRGGLGFSVIIVGTLLAASTGIVGATVVTMGLLSLPVMLTNKYDKRLICGTICASGTLGQIIPPSIVLIILGDQISNAYVIAQAEKGNFSPEPVSVGDLFAGALIPGAVLVGLYLLYQIYIAIFKPSHSPSIPKASRKKLVEMLPLVFQALLPPLILIISVLGSILIGLATPTEASAVGAVGATMLSAIKLIKNKTPDKKIKTKFDWYLSKVFGKFYSGGSRIIYFAMLSLVLMLILSNFFDLRIQRTSFSSIELIVLISTFFLFLVLVLGILISFYQVYSKGLLKVVYTNTAKVSIMVFSILIGASIFSLVLRGFGGDEIIKEALTSLPFGVHMQMLIVMLVIFLLGFIIDFIEITLIVVPLVAPVLLLNDISPVWLAIMIAVNLQTSFLTPPFGFSLFYLRGVAPPAVRTSHIYKGVAPFVLLQILGLVILYFFPILANYLPSVIFGSSY